MNDFVYNVYVVCQDHEQSDLVQDNLENHWEWFIYFEWCQSNLFVFE